MQHNTTKATASQINNLIAIAQATPSEYAHDKAMYTLWDIFGDYVMALVAKNSFLTSSDFSLNGCSPKERKANLAGDAYMVFCKAVQDFDPSMNVPFEAFFANKIRWHVADEKRKNAKRDKVEKVESKLKKKR
jgi:Tfp pilus assembly protein PilV